MSGVENMALDAALLERARETGEAVARIYTWREPTLSLGRNQTALGCYDEGAARRAGVAIVRRPTGGRALLHDHEITYSVTGPTRALSLRTAYGRINAILVDALRRLGVDAHLAEAPPGGARFPDAAPCFVAPSEGEIVLGDRKLVGSAQWREGDALLQHGSMLIDDDQPRIAPLMTVTAPPVPAPATLRDALARVPSTTEIAAALSAAIGALEGVDCVPLALDEELEGRMRSSVPRFAHPEWTWRR